MYLMLSTLAAMTDGANDYTLYALGTSTSKVNFKVGGLPANRTFHVIAWNDDLMGGLTKLADVQSDAAGVVSFDVKSNSFVAVTTLGVELPEELMN